MEYNFLKRILCLREKKTLIYRACFSLIILISLLLIILFKNHLVITIQKMRGYEADFFVYPKNNNESLYKDKVINLDTILFKKKTIKNIVYIAGRKINKQIESNETGYTRGLFNKIYNYSIKHHINLFYYQTAHKPFWLNKRISSNWIDYKDLKQIVSTMDGSTTLIGMSYGGYLTEMISCEFTEIYGITIGGSIRGVNTALKFEESGKNILKCLNQKNLSQVIGNRDGKFESNEFEFDNIFIYKGHHYITSESSKKVISLLNSYFECN